MAVISMNFSSIAIVQREKEIKALKTFLVYSTVGSLVLHIAVLASGMGNFFVRTPELENEKPIELTFVEPDVIPEDKKPLPEDNKLGASEVLTSGGGGGSSGGSEGGSSVKTSAKIQPPPKVSTLIPQNVEKPVIPEKTTTTQKSVENLQRESTTPIQPQKDDPVTSNTPTRTATNNQESSTNLSNLLSQFRDSRATQTGSINGSSDTESAGRGNSLIGSGNGTGSGNGVGFGTGTGTGTGNGNGFGTGTGTGNGNGNDTGNGERRKRDIAVVPTEPKIPTKIQQPQGDNGSTDGRAACSNCKVKYSDSARRRKAEGRVQVAVDTDKDGNVTKVRLASSSGDRELDEEHLRQASNWKLKPSQGGRQGVSIATEYSIEGSRRNRQVRERQQQREERERQVTTSNNSEETSKRRRRNIESSNDTTSSGGESRSSRLNQRIRRTETSTSGDNRRRVRNSEEASLSNRLRRKQENTGSESRSRRREVTAENYQRIQPTRRKRREVNQSSDSGNRLRSILRRSRESTPTTSEGKEGN